VSSIIEDKGRYGFCRLWLSSAEFPDLLRWHYEEGYDPRQIERQALNLADSDSPIEQTAEFVRAVCAWGNYRGVAGRVLKNNKADVIASAFRSALALLKQDMVAEALCHVTDLRGLGISFGSKHLKFLDPARAVVLDSIISGRLGYPLTIDGYIEFLADCHALLEKVTAANVEYPFSHHQPGWRVSEMEMVIFAKLRK
jgi:hypothetical protein